jgi:hypothetical protein
MPKMSFYRSGVSDVTYIMIIYPQSQILDYPSRHKYKCLYILYTEHHCQTSALYLGNSNPGSETDYADAWFFSVPSGK